MVYYIELEFSGHLDVDLFDGALQEALERHPILFSVVQRAKQNKLCWVQRRKMIGNLHCEGLLPSTA